MVADSHIPGLFAAAAFWAQLVRGMWNGSPIDVGILSLPGGLGGAGKHFVLPTCRQPIVLSSVQLVVLQPAC